MSKINEHNYEAFLLDYFESNLKAADVEELKVFILEHPELEIDIENTILPTISENTIEADFKGTLKKSDQALEDELLLDYLEGNLNSLEKQDFEKQLVSDKTLQKAVNDYQKTRLIADLNETVGDKSVFYKSEEDLILADKVIAYLENTLSAEEHFDFKQALKQDKTLSTELDLVSKTILSPDMTLVYPNKESLKKGNKIVFLWSRRAMVSAAAAILLLIGFAILFNYAKLNKEEESILSKITPFKPTPKKASKNFPNASLAKKETDVIPLKAKTRESATVSRKESISTEAIEQEENLALEQMNPTPEPEFKPQETVLNPSETSILAEHQHKVDSNTYFASKQTELLSVEELEGEEFYEKNKSTRKNGLWKRAVQLAQQANKIGVKSVDGIENTKQGYRISFNSFSVEKK